MSRTNSASTAGMKSGILAQPRKPSLSQIHSPHPQTSPYKGL